MPWTTEGAGEAAAVAEGREAGTLGPAPAAAVGEAPTAGEVGLETELRLAVSVALGVEVPVGGVGSGAPAVGRNEPL